MTSATRSRPTVSDRGLPTFLASSVGFLLSKAANLVASDFERALQPHGLSSRSFGVLTLVEEQGPLPQQQIGNQLRIDRTTMVSIIDSLEERGLVTRVKDSQDRRRYAITISERGQALLRDDLIKENQRVEREFLGQLSAQERDLLLSTLLRLVQSDAEEEGPRG